MSGFVYILANESMPGLVKVGCSKKDPRDRALQLFTSGVPTPFKVAFAIFVQDHQQVEANFHDVHDRHRVSDRREFFAMEIEDAITGLFNESFALDIEARSSHECIEESEFAKYCHYTKSSPAQVVFMLTLITKEEWWVLNGRYEEWLSRRKAFIAERKAEREAVDQ